MKTNKNAPLLKLSLAIVLSTLLSCSTKNDFKKTVPYVDRDKFMGTWYVQTGRFTYFEQEAYNATEIYRWNEEKKQIDIGFTFNKGSLTGEIKSIPQTGWIENHTTNAEWKVSPFWPLKFSYLVIALDPNYEWTAIGVPNQSYLWIMSRDKTLPQKTIEAILNELKMKGYDIDNLTKVEHSQ